MPGVRTVERLAMLASLAVVSGLVLLCAGLMPGTSGGGAQVDAARERLERAIAVRYGPTTGDRDERFDALVGALAAGFDRETPRELRESVAEIQLAREAEKRTGAPHMERDERVRPRMHAAVDAAIARCSRVIAYLGAEARLAAPAWTVEGIAAFVIAAVATASLLCSWIARSQRTAERERIVALVGISRTVAHDGRLASEVGRHIAVVRARARAEVRRTLQQPPARQFPTLSEPEPDACSSDLVYGRIVEIRAAEPEEWRDD
jgi:hypothetical protein